MTGAVKQTLSRWDAWDWTGATSITVSVALLVWTLATGDAWPGSEVVLTLGLLGAGLGGVLLLGPGRPADDETKEARDE